MLKNVEKSWKVLRATWGDINTEPSEGSGRSWLADKGWRSASWQLKKREKRFVRKESQQTNQPPNFTDWTLNKIRVNVWEFSQQKVNFSVSPPSDHNEGTGPDAEEDASISERAQQGKSFINAVFLPLQFRYTIIILICYLYISILFSEPSIQPTSTWLRTAWTATRAPWTNCAVWNRYANNP